MKTVEVITPFCLGGGRDVYEGAILEMDDRSARIKIQQGFVKLAGGEEPPAAPPQVTVEMEKTAEVKIVSEPEKHPETDDPEKITSRDPREAAGSSRRARKGEKR